MADTPGIVVTGASGRMGQMLVRTVLESDKARLVGAIERDGHPWIGRDLGEAMGGAALGVRVDADPLDAFARAQAVLDFTAPAATVGFAALAAQARAVHVIGTTGLEAADLAKIAAAAHHAVIVRAGNMSLGVNLLVRLTRMVAEALDEDFDIEIVEAHHARKVDAPSGTALMLGQAAAAGRGQVLEAVWDRGRDGITGARVPGHIGFASIRGGDVVGEHDVIFAGPGERIVLRHLAADRSLFAKGRASGGAVGAGPRARRIRHDGCAGADLSTAAPARIDARRRCPSCLPGMFSNRSIWPSRVVAGHPAQTTRGRHAPERKAEGGARDKALAARRATLPDQKVSAIRKPSGMESVPSRIRVAMVSATIGAMPKPILKPPLAT